MPQCIYCKKRKKQTEFKAVEHVVPQSFGRFEQNLVLNNPHVKKVCDKCNNKFSEFELRLARDTFEGYVLRPEFNISKVKNDKRLRVRIELAEGEYKGLIVELEKQSKINLLPQISLKKKDGDWDYFLLNELDKISKEKYSFERESLRAFGLDDEQAKEAFKRIGIAFNKCGNLRKIAAESSFTLDISSKIDQKVKRAIAKIAFNFFSYFNLKKIILDSAFDEIRKFILNGDGVVPFKVSDEPILYDENKNGPASLGHLITIHRDSKNNIIAQVSLFNYLKYKILLSNKKIHNKKMNREIGRFFDVASKKIFDMKKPEIFLLKNKIIIPNKNLILL